MLQIKRPLTRINLLESSREINVPIDSSINGANLFRKSNPSLALSATNLFESHSWLAYLETYYCTNEKEEDGKCTLSRIYIFELFSLLHLQYLDYMSRKTRIMFSKRSTSYSTRTRRTIAFYPDILRPKSIVCMCFFFPEI